MPPHRPQLGLACLCLFVAACSTQRPLPKYEAPLARAAVQNVRMTAYTHTESDHVRHGRSTALGTTLRSGAVNSAAADWSRWPAGTVFRIRETGEICEVDDYGWALAGTNTIDFYKPSRAAMNAWGVRRVNIEIIRWGDPWSSFAKLEGRSKYRHVARMLKQIRDRYTRSAQAPAPVVSPSPDAQHTAPAGEFIAPGVRTASSLHPFFAESPDR